MNDRQTVYSERPTASDVRQSAIAVLATLAAIFVGFYVGSFTAGVGSPHGISSILLRGVVCAVPSTAFALLMPGFWLLPFVVYGCGFYCGYTFLDGIGGALAAVLVAPVAALTGQRIGNPPEPIHPELLWVLVIAFWCAAFSAFLHRHRSHQKQML